VNQGAGVVLGSAQLSAADVDTAPAAVVFTVAGVQAGRFELVSAPGTAVSSFTQADVNAGNIRFVQDGSGQVPGYSVLLSDGTSTVGPYAGSVSFTAIPPVSSGSNDKQAETQTPTLDVTPLVLAAAQPGRQLPPPALPLELSPGRPDVSFNDLATQFVETSVHNRPLPRLVQPVLSHNEYDEEPPVDLVMQLLNIAPVNLEYRATTPLDWEVAQAFEQNFQDEAQEQLQLMLDSVKFGGMALSVGVVWWASRISAMLGSLLASTPAWRHIDPLPVVSDRDDEKDQEKWLEPDARDVHADELAVSLVLDGRSGGGASAEG
jgi:hypothetical protein